MKLSRRFDKNIELKLKYFDFILKFPLFNYLFNDVELYIRNDKLCLIIIHKAISRVAT